MIVFSLFLFTLKAMIWLILLAFLIATLRLFIFGLRERYAESITDISILKEGDIILVGKQSVLYAWYIQISNVMTRKIKHRFWIHAAIYKGNGMLWEALQEGIKENNISKYLKDGFIIRAFRHKYISDKNIMNKILKYCEDQKDYKYGWVGLAFYVLSTFMPISFNFLLDNWVINKLCNLDKAYFCSELIVDAFNMADNPVSPYDGWRVKPADFISNPLLEPIKINS